VVAFSQPDIIGRKRQAIYLFDLSGENRDRCIELGAQLRRRDTVRQGDLANVDLLDRLFDQQPHIGSDNSDALGDLAIKRMAPLPAG
jgi:hypothetical protein